MSVPAGTKFVGINPSVDTQEKKSGLSNSYSEIYTIEDIASQVTPYDSYVALLTQDGTNDPTAVILENSLGTINFQYDGLGDYRVISPSGAFELGKTFISALSTANTNIGVDHVSAGLIYINVWLLPAGSPGNGLLTNAPFEIRVYK